MTPLNPFIAFSVLHFCLTALGQQISIVTPSVAQCAEVPVQWSGGVPPYSFTVSTVDSNFSSVEDTPVVRNSPYTWVADLPGGTSFQIFVSDSGENNAVTPTIVVQDSTNSSCLDDDDTPPPSSHTGHSSKSSLAGLNTQLPTGTTTSLNPSATGTSGTKGASSSSRVAVIAGVVVGVLVLVAIIVILLVYQKRRDRRHGTSSKEELVRTFGSANADLDANAEEDEMAAPDPYVYGTVSRAQPTPIHTEDLRRNPTATLPSPRRAADRSPSTPASRKGERYLPNYATSPQDSSSPKGSSRSRIEEEDIDRLAARMVAMMSAGRLGDQAWTPGAQVQRNRGLDLDDEIPAPPPMYNDVARRSGPHPSGG